MKTPFTAEQFLNTIRNYNQSVFPMQFVLYIVAVVSIYLAIKPSFNAGKIISGLLAFCWIWMGVAYHLIFFTPVNRAAYLFGTAFVLQGMLFLLWGVFQNKLLFKFRANGRGITGFILIIFALAGYPLWGYSAGHIYPYSPTFGLPCPTTIFTFGMLLLCVNRCPFIILIVPLLWSIVGFTAAFKFGIVEDTGLLVAGLLTIIMLLFRNAALHKH